MKKAWIKKNGSKAGVFCLSLFLCLATASSSMAQTFGVIYNTNTLNLRANASSSSALLGTYKRGEWVEITNSKNNFYYVIAPDGRQGYMSKNYITKGAEAMVDIAMVTNWNGGSFLNFRASPSYNAKVMGIFYPGVPLYVLSGNNGWYKVQINGANGYVRSEYVDVRRMVGTSAVATIKTPNNTSINLRRGPCMCSDVIRKFPGDEYVMVLAKGNGWWRVSIDGYTGFMSSDFLREGLHSACDNTANGGNITSGGAYAVVKNPKNTQALNLRASASTCADVLAKLYNGTRLRVDAQGGEWCRVTVEKTGVSGFVMTRYITLHNLPATPTKKVAHPQGLWVNLRREPNLSSYVKTQVPNGKTVTVLVDGMEWCKVKYNGYEGYMASYFLR